MRGAGSVMLDPPSSIRLLKPDDPLHGHVAGYFRHFTEMGVAMYLSTVVVSGYAAADDPGVLKDMGAFRIADFDYPDAVRAGAFRAFLKGRTGTWEAGRRPVVINDLKLLAQTAVRGLGAFITNDRRMLPTMVDPLRAVC